MLGEDMYHHRIQFQKIMALAKIPCHLNRYSQAIHRQTGRATLNHSTVVAKYNQS